MQLYLHKFTLDYCYGYKITFQTFVWMFLFLIFLHKLYILLSVLKRKKLLYPNGYNFKITIQVQYFRYERGIKIMPVDKMAVFAKYYDVSVDYLLGLTDILGNLILNQS